MCRAQKSWRLVPDDVDLNDIDDSTMFIRNVVKSLKTYFEPLQMKTDVIFDFAWRYCQLEELDVFS